MMRVMTLLAAIFLLALPVQAGPERDVIPMVNALRAKHGLGPLKANANLEKAALRHANDMAKKGYFAHRGQDGSTPGKRAKRAGYRFCKIAENIAQGQPSPAVVMQDWTNSQGHRMNMLKSYATHIGVVRGPGNTWVMMLAAPRGTC